MSQIPVILIVLRMKISLFFNARLPFADYMMLASSIVGKLRARTARGSSGAQIEGTESSIISSAYRVSTVGGR